MTIPMISALLATVDSFLPWISRPLDWSIEGHSKSADLERIQWIGRSHGLEEEALPRLEASNRSLPCLISSVAAPWFADCFVLEIAKACGVFVSYCSKKMIHT
jgi:hypothetical protein